MSYWFWKLSKKDVILPEPSGQNLLQLIKTGDTGSGSGMTKSWSSFESHILFGQPHTRLTMLDGIGFKLFKVSADRHV